MSKYIVAQKDGMLYIAGGSMKYSLGDTNRDGPNPVLRSLNISKGFDTSLESISFIRTEEVPGTIPGVADAAFFPTESGFDLTFGMWHPYNTLEEHNGLITYDQVTDTWKNETTSFGGISEGGLVHISMATDETLVQLGGRSKWSTRIRPFSEIRIYSTNQSKWYTQDLPSGALVPAPRFAFCTTLKSASDGSSHQIYIMGGLEARTSVNATGGATATSIWALSVPSLEWAQLPAMSKTTAAGPRTRISPKCQAIGEHYIFYYGGRNAADGFTTVNCDKQANAAFLFDVNTLTWTDKFTPYEGTYEIPKQVIGLIGGNKSGGSKKKAPAGGWSDLDLETVMTLNTTTPDLIYPSSTPKAAPKALGSNTGVIAGIIVPVIVALALALLAAMLHYRRCQRRRSQLPPNLVKPSTTSSGALGEGGSPTEPMEHTQVNGG
ncbi:hypothetical protein HOY80DRAFT_1137558 [Tuber brumale]|nr:hypothetical protein HOY80DRAFT_1137558 [Tuber brumale]